MMKQEKPAVMGCACACTCCMCIVRTLTYKSVRAGEQPGKNV